MQARVIEEFGEPAVFETREIETPEPGPGEVRIAVAASSVNPVDYKIRRGDLPPFAPEFPAVLGCDVAGTVDAVGDGVTAFEPGDEVYGMPGGVTGSPGALAEYMVADAEAIAPAPESLSLTEAAALPVVALTAWEMLIDRASVDSEDDVLVYGGSGGVGHVGVQIVSAAGARVVATGSTEEKREIAKELGADATVDYTETSVEEYVESHTDGAGFDVVFDPIGDDHLQTAFEAVRPYGRVVTTESSSTQELEAMHLNALSLDVVLVILPILRDAWHARLGEELREIADLVDDGDLAPLLDERRHGFSEVEEAHRRLEEGDALGKIVLENDL
ncbi:zinc-binding dehydrogenase [Halalkalicoccus jeotgali]|uniref:Alcohol dehydrogenase zinc-binding domain protein n=1 Tax=Halalkalicoccus jeotgali (strain DSM 18796 / CECT 7217 / JCM 14584 / KCTC 4019 / B3) TaxID=795797 RepID=D8J376_HALJB|nr:zinc-binding dehydrogenase [Halalkalicoccus jeotgali]ADJ15183.1 Alcohol dehydrogenase zinc-binding domain protein [Halalkalicoccus jeotgali B3]ELY35154.1 alcohol dehydrogenase zinc-binding domain-containing protein [Halalkalicoccus jeotgali B3]